MMRRWRERLGPQPRFLNRQLSLPVSTHLAVMGQPVEERSGHLGVAEDARPLGEGEVGDDESRSTLVKTAHQMEEQLPACLRKGQIAEFVQNHEV